MEDLDIIRLEVRSRSRRFVTHLITRKWIGGYSVTAYVLV